MLNRLYGLLALALLSWALVASCTTTSPGPPAYVASTPAYLPAPLPRRPRQHVLDSLATVARRRQAARVVGR